MILFAFLFQNSVFCPQISVFVIRKGCPSREEKE